MKKDPHAPGAPPLDPAQVARALRATLPAEEAEALVRPLEAGSGWFALSPGLDPIKLAMAVTSSRFGAWLLATLRAPAEIDAVHRIRELPEDQALREIREGRWDPPYGPP